MMIEQEMLEIIGNRRNAGVLLNELADQFRAGRSVVDLYPLLNSKNPEIVGNGAWILGEVTLTKNNKLLVQRLYELLDHDDSSVRFNVLGALYSTLSSRDKKTKEILEKCKNDSNAGVRIRACSAWERLIGE